VTSQYRRQNRRGLEFVCGCQRGCSMVMQGWDRDMGTGEIQTRDPEIRRDGRSTRLPFNVPTQKETIEVRMMLRV
jgi:hypothetical protein